jgi:hypothetical protein
MANHLADAIEVDDALVGYAKDRAVGAGDLGRGAVICASPLLKVSLIKVIRAAENEPA